MKQNDRNSPSNIHLQWFGDGDIGQAVEPPVDDGQGVVTQEPFFTVEVPGESGNEQLSFASSEELQKAFVENYMRHSDYTKKRMADAEARKALDVDKATYAQLLADVNRKQAEIDKKAEMYGTWDKTLVNNPKLRQELMKIKNQPLGGEDVQDIVKQVIEEQFAPTINEMTEWKREREIAEEKQKAFDTLRKKYPNFKDEVIEQYYKELSSGDIATLAEMLHLASLGRSVDPLKIKADVTDSIAKNATAGLAGSSGSQPGVPDKDVSGLSMDQAIANAVHEAS